VIERDGEQSYTVEFSHQKRIMVHLDQMKATSKVPAPEEILELRFAAKNGAEQLELPRVHKIMGNREGPHGMGVLVELMGQQSNESTWVEWQNLAGLPQWLGEFFAIEGENSTSKEKSRQFCHFSKRGLSSINCGSHRKMLELAKFSNSLGGPNSGTPYLLYIVSCP